MIIEYVHAPFCIIPPFCYVQTVRDILGSLGLGMPGGVANATFSVMRFRQ
jgi:hypothetical protein